MNLLKKIKVNLDYVTGKSKPELYEENYRSSNLTLKDWQKRWEIFSNDGNGFIWYGVDTEGNVAEFGSENTYVPEMFFQDACANKKVMEHFVGLPEITESLIPDNLRPELKESYNRLQGEGSFWKTGANKGIFIFDEPEISGFKDTNGKTPYELILIPDISLKISELPNDVQNLLAP